MDEKKTPKQRRSFTEFCSDNFAPIMLVTFGAVGSGILVITKMALNHSLELQEDAHVDLNERIQEAMDAGKIPLYLEKPESTD